MKVVTPEQMREIDRRAILEDGIPAGVLMERAGAAVAAQAINLLFSGRLPHRVAVVAGVGNNGGDALAAARLLQRRGVLVRVFLLSSLDRLSSESAASFKRLLASGVRPVVLDPSGLDDLDYEFSRSDLIVDGIFGTGFRGPARGLAATVISMINRALVPVLAIDIPSGLEGEWGRAQGEAVRADLTVAIGLPKTGLFRGAGIDHAGRVSVAEIGFPARLIESVLSDLNLLTREEMARLIPPRPSLSHKGDWGHVLVLAGSGRMPGAAELCARACLRAGAGLVTVGMAAGLHPRLSASFPEALPLPLPTDDRGQLSCDAVEEALNFKRASLIAIGPGLGIDNGTTALVRTLVEKSELPMVIDADALNILAADLEVLKRSPAPRVLTPHLGEMVRLVQLAPDEVKARREEVTADFARKWGVVMVLKGAATLIAAPEGEIWINSTGNSGMGTAGSGDVLTGLIAGFLAQGLSSLDAARLGVYAHGLAGDLAAAQQGRISLIASDLLAQTGEALKTIFPWNARFT